MRRKVKNLIMLTGTIAAMLLADLSGTYGMGGNGLGVVMAEEDEDNGEETSDAVNSPDADSDDSDETGTSDNSSAPTPTPPEPGDSEVTPTQPETEEPEVTPTPADNQEYGQSGSGLGSFSRVSTYSTTEEDDVFEYTISYSKAKLDNYCSNLKTIYIFTVENAAKLSAICNDAKSFLDSNPGMDSAERMSYVSQIMGQMEQFASKYGFEEIPRASTSEYIGLYSNWEIPTAVYGKSCQIVLPVINYCEEYLNEVVVTPQISADSKAWPFEIEQTDYSRIILSLAGNDNTETLYEHRQEVSWIFQTRDDVATGYYEMKFTVRYDRNNQMESTELVTYVYVQGSPEADNDSEGGRTSTPRIIVTGFETNPAQVFAGDTFTLTLHVQNTSADTTVTNILFDLEAASSTDGQGNSVAGVAPFLPTSGSSTIFQNSISPGGSLDLAIEMTARADLAQKPYVLNVNMDYEDDKANPYTQTANVSIPIYQESKYDISSVDLWPSSCGTGEESNVMFSIYNTGKTTLYNVQVKFDQNYVSGGDVFVGKLESGGTGNVDTMVTAIAPNDGTVTAYISYEDESGNVTTVEKEIDLFIYEMSYEDFGAWDPGMDMDTMGDAELDEKSNTWIYIAAGIAAAVVVIIVIVIIVVKKKKKKKMLKELEDSSTDEIL
ncbi:MAG: hypothetical protein HDQ98_05865 [Lachnospiraceae bacterium]|nr:hypothetical protein [Lachnospiraceae bacterium]